jgi:hypothetical protein
MLALIRTVVLALHVSPAIAHTYVDLWKVNSNYLDGLIFDYEDPVDVHAPEREYYVQLVLFLFFLMPFFLQL